jgi:hypothetical protein
MNKNKTIILISPILRYLNAFILRIVIDKDAFKFFQTLNSNTPYGSVKSGGGIEEW